MKTALSVTGHSPCIQEIKQLLHSLSALPLHLQWLEEPQLL